MSRQADGSVSKDSSSGSISSMQDALDFYSNVPPTDTDVAYDIDSSPQSSSSPLSTGYRSPSLALLSSSATSSPSRAAKRSISSPLLGLGSSPSSKLSSTQLPSLGSPRTQQRSIKDLVNRFNSPPPQDLPASAPYTRGHSRSSETRSRLQKHQPPSSTKPRNVSAPLSRLNGHHDLTTPPRRGLQNTPLFGEIVYDPKSNVQAGHGISSHSHRSGSDESVDMSSSSSTDIKRSRSDAHISRSGQQLHKGHLLSIKTVQVTHKRSVSDLTHDPDNAASYAQQSPQIQSPDYTSSGPTSPDPPSRIPVRLGSTPNPGSVTHRRITSKNYFPAPTSPGYQAGSSPSRPSQLPSLAVRQHDPSAIRHIQPSQDQRAVARTDRGQKSPPLRGLRPRVPVTAATTSASRAKAAQRFEGALSKADSPGSEPTRYRSKKPIPELGRLDFAERRARIQRAMSGAELAEDSVSDRRSASAGSNVAGVGRRNLVDSDVFGYSEPAGTPLRHSEDVVPSPNGLGLSLGDGKSIDLLSDGSSLADAVFGSSPPIASAAGASDLRYKHEVTAGASPESETGQPITLLSHVLRMRARSSSSASRTDIESSPNFSAEPSPITSEIDDKDSMQFVLHEASPASASGWPLDSEENRQEPISPPLLSAQAERFPLTYEDAADSVRSYDSDVAENGSVPSPWVEDLSPNPETPRRPHRLMPDAPDDEDEITPKQPSKRGRVSIATINSVDWDQDSDAFFAVSRIIEEYRTTGDLTPSMLDEFERHVTVLSPDVSDMDGNTGNIRLLLENLAADEDVLPIKEQHKPIASPYPAPTLHGPVDPRTMDSPTGDYRPGTAIIYSSRNQSDSDDKRDTHVEMFNSAPYPPTTASVNSRKLHVGLPADATSGAGDDDFRPPPPPKDDHYSPVSTKVQSRSAEQLRLPDILSGQGLGLAIAVEPPSTVSTVQPPLPTHAPPPQPATADLVRKPDVVSADHGKSSIAASVPASPTLRRPSADDRFRNFSTPARPSTDSRRKPEPLSFPPSQSTTSIQSSNPTPSLDDSAPASTRPSTPSLDMKRLLKRKNIIKELVDTEYSYHQDMKIIEDIYKGTVGDMITPDDKKVLFGNADQIEAFSLEFYDALRRSVTGVYVPPKSLRWQNERSSFATDNSGERDSVGDILDEDRDATSRVGEVFAHFMAQMEKVYGTYLKNHDSANQRLAKLQTDETVKCWLAECHRNASDITSAWDLDSLLVKPVQRILKYPLLLHQLVEATSAGHPDRQSLEFSAKEIMNVTHRINEAKKRADLVEQMVSRKRKESDVRSGLAKAFGRRTEKLKERVGIAEAYQDADFDELAHKFGGHFVRLQVCMRDVQGSIAEVDKAVNHFLQFADALEAYVEVSPCTSPDVESKWRKFILAIRDLATVGMPDHKMKLQNHVIKPILTAIELHKGPQNAIQKRKKRLLDYAKCKSMEKAGQKPDKKLLDASELYLALNEQLKIELPRLYSLTSDLVKACLDTNVFLQTQWMWLWKTKLAPVLDILPRSDESQQMINLGNIVPSFALDYDIAHSQTLGLSICNGSLLAEASNFLSPQSTLMGEESTQASRASSRTRRPSNLSGSRSDSRKMSFGSASSPYLVSPDLEKSFNLPLSPDMSSFPNERPGFVGRMRSTSSLSANRGRTPILPQNSTANTAASSRMPSLASKSSFSTSRPATANNRPADYFRHSSSRIDTIAKDGRPSSGQGYLAAAQDRFSGMFSSAMPLSDSPTGDTMPTSPKHASDDTPVMFVAASLFEFNIDRARREAGYPYLTYVEGEVFDVVAQKGELWLAKNQDDASNSLGWIWEQHFVILSQDA